MTAIINIANAARKHYYDASCLYWQVENLPMPEKARDAMLAEARKLNASAHAYGNAVKRATGKMEYVVITSNDTKIRR